MISGAQF